MNRRAAGLALVIVFAAQALVVMSTAARDPHIDEVEYLHTGWLIANGERLYETFFEHHSPLLFAPLSALAPRGEGVDVKPYAMRARWLFGTAGLIALGAFAAILWRVDPWAAVIGVSALFASGPLWLRCIAEVRAEPVALALFCIGAACVVLPQERYATLIGGVGVGLLVVAGLWTPKWPLTSAFIAALWLVRVLRGERKAWAFAAAIGVAACGMLAIRYFVPFKTWWFFNFTVNAQFVTGRTLVAEELLRAGQPFLHVPAFFRPAVVVVVAAIVLGAAWFRRDRVAALFVAFFVVAAIELRLVLPYPSLWTHYFAMWSLGAAALLALIPRSVSVIRGAWPAAVVTALVVLWANAMALWAVGRSGEGIDWASQRRLASALKPGQTVWIMSQRHPISARDAHYYWFAAPDIVGALSAIRSPLLPPAGEAPTCVALRSQSMMRFVSGPKTTGEVRCFNALLAGKRLTRTSIPDIYELVPR